MLRWIGIVAVLSLMLPLGQTAQAAADGAGCGLGQELFKGQSGIVPHVLAAISNGISSNQAFGISSGTSGCNPDSVILNEKEKEVFVAVNLEALSSETARGTGPSLDALAELMGCPTALSTEFGAAAQARYPELATQATPQAWLSTFEAGLHQTPLLAAGCTRIG